MLCPGEVFPGMGASAGRGGGGGRRGREVGGGKWAGVGRKMLKLKKI